MPTHKAGRKAPVILLHNLDYTWGENDSEYAVKEVSNLETAIRNEGHTVINLPVLDADISSLLREYNPENYVIFNYCEDLPGIPHSEAIAAKILESLNFSFTGSSSETLETCWDKRKTKQILNQFQIATPQWKIYESPKLAIDDWNIFPAIVKPAFEHCSYGVSSEAVVLKEKDLRERISYVLEAFSQPALVEEFIDGREFHVSLIGNENVFILPPAEMDFSKCGRINDRLCTFDSKFNPDSDHYNRIEVRIPVSLTPSERKEMKSTALKSYFAIKCRDYARIDLRLKNGVFYVLDVNANPDISSETSMAYAAAESDLSYGEMISGIIDLASLRHPVFSSDFRGIVKNFLNRKIKAAVCDIERELTTPPAHQEEAALVNIH